MTREIDIPFDKAVVSLHDTLIVDYKENLIAEERMARDLLQLFREVGKLLKKGE